jgi:D-glycero-D-manno-heptose 1,7-bisphosphate phosphatase
MRGLILDRDGVINHETGYLHRIEDCRFMDGIFDLTRAFADHGFRLAIATNQSGIGRGLYSEADFQTLMAWMLARFRAHGVSIDAVYHCPDHPTEGLGPYRRDNPWRKPAPGMFLQAIADLELDPEASWAIGDEVRDIEAAARAGIGHRVRLDPAAPAVRREAGHWVVPRLDAVLTLMERT